MINMDHVGTDTNVEENEAYGVAVDGIGTDVMKRNIAYGEITFQDISAGNIMTVDWDKNDGIKIARLNLLIFRVLATSINCLDLWCS